MARFLLVLNLVGACAAFISNIWAAFAADKSLRARFLAISWLAVALSVGIAGQILWSDTDWFALTNGIAIAAWWVVWVWPAVSTVRRWQHVREEVIQGVEDIRRIVNK